MSGDAESICSLLEDMRLTHVRSAMLAALLVRRGVVGRKAAKGGLLDYLGAAEDHGDIAAIDAADALALFELLVEDDR